MKKIYFLLLFLSLLTLNSFAQVTTIPSPAEASEAVTLNFNKAGTGLNAYNGVIYAHIGLTIDGVQWQNVKGTWGNNSTQPALTLVSGSNYTLNLSPDLYTYFNVPTTSSITQICVVFRGSTGTPQTTDYFINVGAFQATLNSPAINSNTILNSGANLSITASNTNGNADYNLLANGVSINAFTGSSYAFTDTNITNNKNYELQITQGGTTFSRNFNVIVNPGTISQAIPTGLEDGINYNISDPTKATLKLNAPGKDFVYVAGSFNNWQPDTSYAMRRDPSTNIFWLELTGLTPGQVYTYQYWVVDQTPVANSPVMVKAADMYSTLVLSPFDDPWIPAASYPNLPTYPQGQQREVTVLQTAQPAYSWSAATTNFVKPNKDNLVIYEVLIRDFDANRNFQDLINRIDYFKNLKVNAIELMPIMEFEGNESWGYNTSFHMALDKFYGTSDKFKEFVDLCHQNGIAVILDLALNHAFGRNPGVRMWMNDPDGDGWGPPSTDNPYFNTVARHSYSVGEDFNHQSEMTKYYTKRVIKHWIEEYKIDGFRWDLTKGFTQNCTGGNEICTNAYQADRVAVLKEYADYSWSLDPNHYVIFEHLGSDNEEQQWANYRLNEGKGIMMWGELWEPYKQLISGNSANANINRVGHVSRGFQGKRLIGYPESHDKDRIIYEAVTFGNGGGTTPVNGNLNNAINRIKAIAATNILVPGPKMVWHFASLGMGDSIWTCSNGTINSSYDAIPGDCKLDTKPQPQWTQNWLADPLRNSVYNTYAKLNALKTSQPVFNGEYSISPNGDNLRQRIYVFDNSLPASQLKNVVVLANFSVSDQNITPDFPYTGIWYDLMTETPLNVTSTTAQITLAPGEFRVYGNQMVTLNTDEIELADDFAIHPNPASTSFTLNVSTNRVEVYSLTGQLVKSFTSAFSENHLFDISELNSGVYLVKASDSFNREKVMKLIKN
ncbi:alpha-amylase family glycosyl hydrolase [Flavobacterium sp. UBA6135]|uniref:alpha-amylase family glycosyl hydrolase n=1 Tax=Flavobacterium sp. UBA6135 TaxID=1946553 RepID=UPI0025B83748|nr:alpha-amylase family glycosyl hydrolase [Flavobacterium sp. UBA6135]